MRRHPSLGVEYEAIDIIDQGPAPDGCRHVQFVLGYLLAGELRLLTLDRVVDPDKLAQMRKELTA